jgi:glycosyltransferase involved in cell wall biosynthesis
MERRICAAADYVVLQAHGLTDHLLEDGRVPSSKVRILTNSVDTGFWSPGNGRPPPNGHQRECRLLFVGGIDVSKGMVAMIETLHLLKEWGHPARLTIVGKWGHAAKSAAFRLLDRYGVGNKIDLLPRTSREELRQVYRDADLFLYQTINDGSPRVVLEALACGLPVIASRHPGIDVIDPGEDFIAFTDFGDANQMARFVRDFSERPDFWQQRAKAGRQAVDDRFSIPTVARQYVEFYQSLTENAPAEWASAT